MALSDMLTDEDGTPSKVGWSLITAVVTAVILVVGLSVIGIIAWNDGRNEDRGRGDAPVGQVIDQPVDVIQFPDRFSNVAHTCDGHGHRVYVTTKSDQSRFMVVIDDPTCNDNEGE